MTEQFPSFRHTVALQMESYNERIAARIKRERERRGEDPEDAARRAAISLRTYERWEAGERKPQLKNLAALAEAWGVGIEKLRPDLEEDAERLERIETKLDLLLTNAGLPIDLGSLVPEVDADEGSTFPSDPNALPNAGQEHGKATQ